MTQFTILSGKAMIVELPEGATNPIVDDYLLGYNLPPPEWAAGWGDESYDTINLPPGNWHIVGMLSEVTGEQAEELVEWVVSKTSSGTIKKYRDYRVKTVSWGLVKNAIESLESAILAEGWCFENPYGKEPLKYTPDEGSDYVPLHSMWQKAQSRVLCRERCLLLGREI